MSEIDGTAPPYGTAVPPGGWAQVFERSPIAMGIAVDLTYTQANEALCELVGLPVHEVVGRDVRDFLSAELQAEIPGALAAVEQGRRRLRFEGTVARPDGEYRWSGIDVVVIDGTDPTITVIQATDLTDLRRARNRLSASERQFRSLLSNISDTVSLTDAAGKLLFSTGRDTKVLGYDGAFWEGLTPLALVHPDDLERAASAWARSLELPGEEVNEEVRMRDAAGHWVDVAVTGVNLLDDPEVGGVVVTSRNVSAIRRAERLSTSQAAVLELIARGAPLAEIFERCVDLVEANGMGGRSSIYLLDPQGRLEMRAGRAPRALNEFVRAAPHDPARSVCDLTLASGAPTVIADVNHDDRLPDLAALAADLDLAAAWSYPIRSAGAGEVVGTLSTIYGQPHTPDRHEHEVAEVAVNLVSVALERVADEDRLAHQALHDGLTGLPNRTLLLDRLDHALGRRERVGGDIAVLFCDLDRFKVVNDSLGHGVGDQLLVAVADRLAEVVAPGDTVARFGGDEFVVLIEDVIDAAAPVEAAERIAAALDRSFVLPAGEELYLTVSIGIAIASDHTSGDGWLRDADAAMYRAKERGRNRLELFDTEMRDAAMARMQIETDLRRAVERAELVVHYQPIVDLRTGRISGAEALVRWQHPERGLLPPDDFIAVAEETGTIDEIGRHVLDQAVGDVSDLFRRVLPRPFQLGVNLSARQLGRPGLPQAVEDVCRRHGWPLTDLLLEITESALTQGTEEPLDVLDRIRALGVQLAIDDFGTGHSSLTRLGRMPVGQVKVDRTFVAAMDEADDRMGRLLEAVVAVAGVLDLRISAEGIESAAQLVRLRAVGCDLGQGYFFSKPLPVDELEALLEADPLW